MNEMNSIITILGDEKETMIELINQIKNSNKDNDLIENSLMNSSYDWIITNKYYSAKVTFKLVHDIDFVSEESEAIIIISKDKNFNIIEKLNNKKNFMYCSTYLFVYSNPFDTTEDTTSVKECLEYGYEFINYSNKDFNINDNTDSKIYDRNILQPLLNNKTKQINILKDTNSICYERILEALHCTSWKSMNRKDNDNRKNHTNKSSNNTISNNNIENENILNNQNKISEKGHRKDQACIDSENFEDILEKVKNIRMNASKVSENYRKKNAAEMAIKLWNILKIDDSDSDDDNENLIENER